MLGVVHYSLLWEQANNKAYGQILMKQKGIVSKRVTTYSLTTRQSDFSTSCNYNALCSFDEELNQPPRRYGWISISLVGSMLLLKIWIILIWLL